MFKNIFLKAGLSPTQADILAYLFQKKEGKASQIARAIKKSRTIVYKDLDEMTALDIVEKIDKPNQVSIFRLGHPSYLEKFFDQKEQEIKKDRKLFISYLPDMISAYNLLNNKPGIKYYEGKDGIKKILWDSLNSKTEIYTISDTKSVRKNLKELNEEYIKKRKQKGIKKRLIVPISAKKDFTTTKSEFTEIRFLDEKYHNFKTGLQIYDNKISYQTLAPDKMIGVLIEDENIFTMHKMLFEYIWDNLAKNNIEKKDYFNKDFIT